MTPPSNLDDENDSVEDASLSTLKSFEDDEPEAPQTPVNPLKSFDDVEHDVEAENAQQAEVDSDETVDHDTQVDADADIDDADEPVLHSFDDAPLFEDDRKPDGMPELPIANSQDDLDPDFELNPDEFDLDDMGEKTVVAENGQEMTEAEYKQQQAIDNRKIEAYALEQSSDYDIASASSNLKQETSAELHSDLVVPVTKTMSGSKATAKTINRFEVKSDYVPPPTPDEEKKHEIDGRTKIGMQTLKNVIDTMPEGAKKELALQRFAELNPTPEQQAKMPEIVANKAPEVVIQTPTSSSKDRGR